MFAQYTKQMCMHRTSRLHKHSFVFLP